MGRLLSDRLGDWTPDEFEEAGREVISLLADRLREIDSLPVSTEAEAAFLRRLLESPLPDEGEPFDAILVDTKSKVIPHLTHWNHPRFFAYFATSASGPGILADTMISALNVNAMLWKSSPAASALEQVVLRWMAEMIGYPAEVDGVLVNGAALATFYALTAAREETGFDIRNQGMAGREIPVLRVYCSEHAHNSIDKAMIALGIGLQNLIKIESDAAYRMRPERLREAIEADLQRGYRPFAVMAVVGTTSTGAVDPVAEIGTICQEHGLWLHVDAAYGGFYNLVPEIRAAVGDLRSADSIVANPHKTLLTPLEVSALYCRRKGRLAAAFSLVPAYLQTEQEDGAVDYMNFSLQLGRSFRALKLWWVIRSFGRRGLAARMAEHRQLARTLEAQIAAHPDFLCIAGSPYPLVCLRAFPRALKAEYAQASATRRVEIEHQLNQINAAIIQRLNGSGQLYITHTVLPIGFTIRVAIGNIRTSRAHVEELWTRIQEALASVIE